ncbi:MAG TPA: hypothetical protein VGF61_06170 [Candidatus Acidoferrum sp.]
MCRTRIIASTIFVLLALGTTPPQFAQDPPTNAKGPSMERHATMLAS